MVRSSSEMRFITPTDERTKDDPQVRRPDISKAKRVLSWQPKIGLEEGLRKTIEWFREQV